MVTATQTTASKLPTRWGEFKLLHFALSLSDVGEHEALALVHGQPVNPWLCRIHSECLTGEALGSLRCDCRAQLDLAFERIVDAGAGAILYLRQEGRGIGLANKIRAYHLQDQGKDTVDANLALQLPVDARGYEAAVAILTELGVGAVRLMTNNPGKRDALTAHGIAVAEMIPHWTPTSAHSEGYVAAKRSRLGHTGATDSGER